MCGRYSLDRDINDLIKRYRPTRSIKDFKTNDEIFPSEYAPVVLNDGENLIAKLKWGFIPSYGKQLLINARAETVMTRPSFKNSFYRKRCLIPISSFYEWVNLDGKKIRKRIALPEEDLISLGGLFDVFKDKEGKDLIAFTIITTEARGVMKEIHHRMPLIIERENEDVWLDNSYKDMREVEKLLEPYEGEFLIE